MLGVRADARLWLWEGVVSWTFTIGLCLLIMGLFKTTALWPLCIGGGAVLMVVALFRKGKPGEAGAGAAVDGFDVAGSVASHGLNKLGALHFFDNDADDLAVIGYFDVGLWPAWVEGFKEHLSTIAVNQLFEGYFVGVGHFGDDIAAMVRGAFRVDHDDVAFGKAVGATIGVEHAFAAHRERV